MVDQSELVNTIVERTREGKLSWEELSLTGFLTRVGDIGIIVDRTRGAESPSMRITDETGKVLEVIDGPIYSGEGLGTRNLLSELYELARRQALNVDEMLSELQRKLDRL